jgi:hypothetical protein
MPALRSATKATDGRPTTEGEVAPAPSAGVEGPQPKIDALWDSKGSRSGRGEGARTCGRPDRLPGHLHALPGEVVRRLRLVRGDILGSPGLPPKRPDAAHARDRLLALLVQRYPTHLEKPCERDRSC